MRHCQEPGSTDLLAAAQTLAKCPVPNSAKGVVDVVNQTSGLRGEQKCLFAFHRVGPLISHVEGMTRMIAGGLFGGRIKIHILKQAHIAHQLLAAGKKDLLKSL